MIWVHQGSTLTETAWTEQVYDLSSLLPAATIRIRWVIGVTDSSVTYCGWNIDDITLEGAVPCWTPEIFIDDFESGACDHWSLEMPGN